MARRRNVVLGTAAAAAAAAATVAAIRRVDRSPLAVLDDGEQQKLEMSDGAVLTVDVAGPDDGPTVVLAHCWGGDPANWAPVAARLVDDGYRVVRWYQRGHGPSTVGHDGFAIERFGADLAEVLEALDVTDAVVAGHSLGGMTAQSFAIHHHDVLTRRVLGLVLVATSAGGLASTTLGRSSGRLLANVALLDRALGGPYGHLLVRGALGRGATPAAVRATRDHFVSTPAATRSGIAQAMLVMDLREGGRSITVPTTVVVGSRDTLTPPRHSRALAAAIPGAELVVIPGAGHMLPMEAAEQVVTLIEKAHTDR